MGLSPDTSEKFRVPRISRSRTCPFCFLEPRRSATGFSTCSSMKWIVQEEMSSCWAMALEKEMFRTPGSFSNRMLRKNLRWRSQRLATIRQIWWWSMTLRTTAPSSPHGKQRCGALSWLREFPRSGLEEAFEQLLQLRRVKGSLPSGIRGIVAFTSVKTLCTSCREIAPDAAHSQKHEGTGTGFLAPGCPECRYSGYGGKKFLLDVLPFDPELREILASARQSAELSSYLREKGYHGIPEKLAVMLRNGEISLDEYQAALPQ